VDWWEEFKELLVSSARKVARFQTLLPAAFVYAVPLAFGSSIAVQLVRMAMESPDEIVKWGQQWSTDYSGLVSMLVLAIFVCAPAVASGIVSQADAATRDEEAGLSRFWGGLGVYYWRIVGAYLLIGILGVLVSIPLAPDRWTSYSRRSASPAEYLASTAIMYFLGSWIAAAVVDGSGVTGSLGRSARFAWKNPGLLLPAFLSYTVSGRIIGGVQSLFLRTVRSALPVVFSVTGFMGGFVTGTASAILYMVFLAFQISAYRLKMAPVLAPADGGVDVLASGGEPSEQEDPDTDNQPDHIEDPEEHPLG